MTYILDPLPATIDPCDHEHGLIQRDMTGATYEQKFCGEWWDCPRPGCHFSRLYMSNALIAQLKSMGWQPTPPPA